MKKSMMYGVTGVAVMALAATAVYAGQAKKNIVETAAAAGSFDTLLKAAKTAGVAETLATEGPLTVFAPTDEAFAKLPEGALQSLLDNPAQLKAVLMHHVVQGKVMAADAQKLEEATSLHGHKLAIDASDGVEIGGAKVVKADIEAANGVIHVIDSVLLPDDIVKIAAGNADFETLVAAVKAAGLVETLKGAGPYTVFAPTDAAFDKLPAGALEDLLKPENKDKLTAILTHHVVPGFVTSDEVMKLASAKSAHGGDLAIGVEKDADGEVTSVSVGDATVVKTDIIGSNGVIHVIDAVLLP